MATSRGSESILGKDTAEGGYCDRLGPARQDEVLATKMLAEPPDSAGFFNTEHRTSGHIIHSSAPMQGVSSDSACSPRAFPALNRPILSLRVARTAPNEHMVAPQSSRLILFWPWSGNRSIKRALSRLPPERSETACQASFQPFPVCSGL